MQTKKWIFLLSAITCLQLAVSAQPFLKGEDGRFLRKGYTAVLSEAKLDTQIIVDPITGEEIWKTRVTSGSPDKINGKKVYYDHEVTTRPRHSIGALPLDEYIMTNIKPDIEKLQLPDGALQVALSRIIIDEKGKIVYYEYNGITLWQKDITHRIVNDAEIAPKIFQLLEAAPTMKPATLNGKNVAAYLSNSSLYDFKIEINSHAKK